MKNWFTSKSYWLKGGIVGMIIGFLLLVVFFSMYPRPDNLYVIFPVYTFCRLYIEGLKCTWHFVFGGAGFVLSILIHFIIYFLIGMIGGLIIGRIKKHSVPEGRL
jgi:hypothetical protein